MSWSCVASFTGHHGAVYALIAAEHPGTFFSGSGDGHVVRWDLRFPDKGEVVVDVGKAVFTLHLTKDRRTLFVGHEAGGLHVIDLKEREETQLFKVHRKGIFSIVALPGDRIAVAGGDGSISVWKSGTSASGSATLDLQRQIPLCEEKVRGFALNAKRTLLAVACGDGSVRVLDTKNFNETHTLAAHEGGCNSVAWHPRKPVLVSGGKDGHLRTWNSDDKFRALHAITAHKGSIYCVAFNASGSLCATSSRDKSAKLWDANSFDPVVKLDVCSKGHTHSVNALLWLGEELLTSSDDKRIIRWGSR